MERASIITASAYNRNIDKWMAHKLVCLHETSDQRNSFSSNGESSTRFSLKLQEDLDHRLAMLVIQFFDCGF